MERVIAFLVLIFSTEILLKVVMFEFNEGMWPNHMSSLKEGVHTSMNSCACLLSLESTIIIFEAERQLILASAIKAIELEIVSFESRELVKRKCLLNKRNPTFDC